MPKRVPTRDPEIFKIGKSYYFRGTVGGVRIEDKKLLGSSFTIAKENKDNLKSELERVGLAALKSKSGNLFDQFLAHREKEFKLGEIRKRTIVECRDLLRLHIKPYFENKVLAEIEDAWIDYKLHKKHLDLSNHRKVLSMFLKWCRKKKLIKYVGELEMKAPKRKQRINLTDEEISQFYSYILTKKGNTPIIAVAAILMGNRGGELKNLRIDQVNFENMSIELLEEDTKTDKARVVPLHPYVGSRLKLILEKIKASGIKTNYFFYNQADHTRPMQNYHKTFEKHRKNSGVKRHFTLHDLRATIEGRSHVDSRFTDKQREAMFGSSVKVQKDIYAKLHVEHLRGLLSVMQIEALDSILKNDLTGRIGDKDDCG